VCVARAIPEAAAVAAAATFREAKPPQPPIGRPSLRARIAHRAGHNVVALSPNDDASTTFSDGSSSSSSFSTFSC